MKICLVRPTYGSRFQVNPPLSLGYLSASLKANGYDNVSLVDGSLYELTPAQAVDACRSAGVPDVVGIQVYTGSHSWTKSFVALAKEAMPSTRIIVGGPHVTALKGLALEYLGAGYGVMGEGEGPIVQFVRWLEGAIGDPSDVSGLIYRKDGAWMHAKTMFGFVENANDLPTPDWELLQPHKYFPYLEGASVPLRGRNATPVMSSRGCPFRCTFCSSGLTNKHVMRYRLSRNIVDEIKHLRDQYGVDEVFFSDDNLTMNLQRAEEIFDLLINERVGVHWRAPNGLRIDRLSEPLVRKMAASGCYYVGVGIETGNADMMKRIRKHVDLDVVRNAVALLRKHGILVNGFFMCGLRGETAAQVEESIRFACSVPFDRVQVSNFIPYPGSEDFEDIFGAGDPATYRANVMAFQEQEIIPPFQEMSLPEIIALQKTFIKRFYLRPRVMWSLLRTMRFSQIKAILRHPHITRWFRRNQKWYADK